MQPKPHVRCWMVFVHCYSFLFQIKLFTSEDDEKELPSFDGSFIPSWLMLLPLRSTHFLPSLLLLGSFYFLPPLFSDQLYSPFQQRCSPDSKHQRPCRRFCCQVEFPALDTIKWWPRVCKPAWEYQRHEQARNRPIWCSLCYRWANSVASSRDAARDGCDNRRCRLAVVAGSSGNRIIFGTH